MYVAGTKDTFFQYFLEFLEYLEDICSQDYMYNDVCSRFKSSHTMVLPVSKGFRYPGGVDVVHVTHT